LDEEFSTYHVAQDEADSPPVHDGELEGLDLTHALVAFSVSLDTTSLQTSDGDGAFAFSQAFTVGGKIEEDERGANSPDNGRNTFYYEQPSPAAYVSDGS
jgi:hypothetical protein